MDRDDIIGRWTGITKAVQRPDLTVDVALWHERVRQSVAEVEADPAWEVVWEKDEVEGCRVSFVPRDGGDRIDARYEAKSDRPWHTEIGDPIIQLDPATIRQMGRGPTVQIHVRRPSPEGQG